MTTIRHTFGSSIDCLPKQFTAQAERTPDAIAVTNTVNGDEGIIYRELNQRANQLAHHLQKLGVDADALVGICLTRSVDMTVALMGILKVGGAYIPARSGSPSRASGIYAGGCPAEACAHVDRTLRPNPRRHSAGHLSGPRAGDDRNISTDRSS